MAGEYFAVSEPPVVDLNERKYGVTTNGKYDRRFKEGLAPLSNSKPIHAEQYPAAKESPPK